MANLHVSFQFDSGAIAVFSSGFFFFIFFYVKKNSIQASVFMKWLELVVGSV
jgi:hypothetical protein